MHYHTLNEPPSNKSQYPIESETNQPIQPRSQLEEDTPASLRLSNDNNAADVRRLCAFCAHNNYQSSTDSPNYRPRRCFDMNSKRRRNFSARNIAEVCLDILNRLWVPEGSHGSEKLWKFVSDWYLVGNSYETVLCFMQKLTFFDWILCIGWVFCSMFLKGCGGSRKISHGFRSRMHLIESHLNSCKCRPQIKIGHISVTTLSGRELGLD